MAHFGSIAAAGLSVVRLLKAGFAEQQPIANAQCAVELIRTEDFDRERTSTQLTPPALSVYLYRVDFNKTMRAAWSAVGSQQDRAILPLDLHYLITPWAANAQHEQLILGRAMQYLEAFPILSGPLLDPTVEWAPNEAIQLVLDELSTEAVMRIFDSLPTDYRLSVPYLARVVRIEAPVSQQTPMVTSVVRESGTRRPR